MKVEIEKIITEAFNTLDKEINRYVVMNKYDVLPYELPSDIDICVEQSDFERLDDIIKKVAHNTNTIVAQKIWHNYRKCAYILTPIKINESFRLQLDFFSDFSVSCTPKLISYDEILNNTRCHGRFLVPKYELEYIFLLMRRIFKNDFSLEHIRLFKSIILRNRKSSFEYGIKYFDKDIFKEVEDAIINEDLDGKIEKMKNLRDLLKKEIIENIEEIKINSPEDGVCHILNVTFYGIKGEVLLHYLEQKGVYVSTGSACSSKKKGSHVLNAIGLSPQEIEGAIRFSLSDLNTEEEIKEAVKIVKESVSDLRMIMRRR